jgi:hypothetical protein
MHNVFTRMRTTIDWSQMSPSLSLSLSKPTPNLEAMLVAAHHISGCWSQQQRRRGDDASVADMWTCCCTAYRSKTQKVHLGVWGAIHQLLSIILKSRILVLLLVSTLSYVAKVENYSLIGE